MHIFHSWDYVGLYGEKYNPLSRIYGLKIYEGYVCLKCGKTKLIETENHTYWCLQDYNDKIKNLRVARCKIVEVFKNDAREKYLKQ